MNFPKQNMLDDWLDEHGDPEIERDVELELFMADIIHERDEYLEMRKLFGNLDEVDTFVNYLMVKSVRELNDNIKHFLRTTQVSGDKK